MTTVRRLWIILGVFFLSLGVLVFEIALTRIFSVIQTYHFVFLIISIAMLGLSLGGVFEFFWRRRAASTGGANLSVPLWAMGVSIAMALFIFLVVISDIANALFLLILLTGVPFFFAGVVFASVFRKFAEYSAALYAADLIGAAVGALIVIWVLNTLGGPNAILSAAIISATGSALLGLGNGTLKQAFVAFGILALGSLGLILNVYQPWLGPIPVGRNLDKDLYRVLQNPSVDAEIIDTRWSAFGRTDLLRRKGDATMLDLFVDGAAGTAMLEWNGSVTDTSESVQMLKHHFTGVLPLGLLDDHQKDNALIIGPGGGRDVLVSLLYGIKDITAVEVNPDFVAMVRKYSDFNGGIYSGLPNVEIVVDEGRNFVKRSKDQYDLILLTLPITKSSRSYEGYALTENFLFTREAFKDYLTHLTPEGSLIIINHGYLESMKLLTTALSAFGDLGLSVPETMNQIYVLGHEMMPVFGIRKTAPDSIWTRALHVGLHNAGFDGQTSYVPYVKQVVKQKTLWGNINAEWRMMNQNMIDLAERKVDLAALIDSAPIDLKPATDDRPFFFKIEPDLPGVLKSLFWFAGLFLAAVIVVPKMRQRNATEGGLSWRFIVLFVGIGIGFMLIEITLFQKLVLYVGQPVFALALLLFSLLIGTGLGSLTSGRIQQERILHAIALLSGVVVVLALVGVGFVDMVFARLLADPALLRVAVFCVLVVFGFAMGFPFPLGIRFLKMIGQEDVIPWMWGLNGAASVFGSVLAVILAVVFGYSMALVVGAGIYAVVCAVFLSQRFE